ncbi:MAG: LysR family transcriptional regulator [Pseudomonadales bacterium]|nr:LysR family transcriptional regulator [Halioglobus sp.]MCP5129742.1 LysR family transcriptional regulator [Pseudomonadales bacterium]
MDIRELGRLDLNLLVALEALIEEGNVSRAAERLFISQSAMSKTLGRLRELFDDPLFIRKGSGMVPTPRAEQLAELLPKVLLAVQDMLTPPTFDPISYEGQFNLLVQGHMGQWLLPLLIERLSQRAPLIRLSALSRAEKPFDQLNNGKLDFILQAHLHKYPPGLRLTTLGYAPPLLLARQGHPLEGKELTWEDVLPYPHVQLVIDELANIQFLTGKKSSFLRQMATVVPNLVTDQLLTAIQVVRGSDYLFPAPPLFLEQADLSHELIALPLPEGEEVTLRYVMVNHERVDVSPAHMFVYREIMQVIDSFRVKYGLSSLAQLRAQRKLAY